MFWVLMVAILKRTQQDLHCLEKYHLNKCGNSPAQHILLGDTVITENWGGWWNVIKTASTICKQAGREGGTMHILEYD